MHCNGPENGRNGGNGHKNDRENDRNGLASIDGRQKMTKAGEIYVAVGLHAFKLEFVRAGRGDSFTDKGFEALYELIKQESADINEPYELDVIEICTNYTEYETIEEYNEERGIHCTAWDEAELAGCPFIPEGVERVNGTESAICYNI